jgi:glycosyltransferase involved in cell wall biosynthesis
MSRERAPRVAYLTPLQPIESGISQYSEDLIPWLASAVRLDVVVDGYRPLLASSLRPAHIREVRRFDPRRYDATIISMGNSPAHSYMVPIALGGRHILVLHDIVLQHLMVWRAVQQRGGREAYRKAMRDAYGETGDSVAARVLLGQNPPAMFDYPLNEELIRAARVVVVHSPSSAAWVERLVPEARTHVVPMGVPPIAPVDRAAARARFGIAPETFVILSLGRVNPFKRMPAVFRAVRRLADARPDVQLVIIGGDSPNYDVPRLARFAGVERNVRRLGYVPDGDLPDLFAAADVCVNLRHPTAGETSAAVLRLMSAGLPTIVTDTGAFADLPDDAVLKVPPNGFEGEVLVAYLRALADDPGLRAAVGTNARTAALRDHSMRRATEGYLDVLSAVTGRTIPNTSIQEPARSSHPVTAQLLSVSVDAQQEAEHPDDPLLAPVAQAIAELGLTETPGLVEQTARALGEMHLGTSTPRKKS